MKDKIIIDGVTHVREEKPKASVSNLELGGLSLMTTKPHLMVDIESLGNDCICQIGMCSFDIETGEVFNQYRINIDFDTISGSPNPSTVKWWLQQSKEVQDSVLNSRSYGTRGETEGTFKMFDVDSELEVFKLVDNVFSEHKRIWSHATFDFVSIMNVFKRLGIKPKFSWKHAMDIRTLVNLARTEVKGFMIDRVGVQHDALNDCLTQVKYVVAAYNKLKGK